MSASSSSVSVGTKSTEKVDVSPPSIKKYSIIVGLDGAKGRNATKWSSRCGALIRSHIPIGYEEWRKVDDFYKEHLWKELMKEFEMNVDPKIARPILEKKFPQYFRTVKSTLRKKYFKKGGRLVSKCVAIDNRPEDVDKVWWEKFVNNEYSDKKKEQCKKNAENKIRNSITHTLTIENPKEKLTRSMAWKWAHKNRKTGEVLPCAAENFASKRKFMALIEVAEERQKLEVNINGSNGITSPEDFENDPMQALIEATEESQKLEVDLNGNDGTTSLEDFENDPMQALIEAAEERQKLEMQTLIEVAEERQMQASIEAEEEKQKLEADLNGSNGITSLEDFENDPMQASIEAEEEKQKLEADLNGSNGITSLEDFENDPMQTLIEATEERENLEADLNGNDGITSPEDVENDPMQTLKEAAEERQNLKTDLNGSDGTTSPKDFENDPIAEGFRLRKRKSYCCAIDSTATMKQVKFTQASKAIANSKESKDLRQWKMEIQNQVQNQISNAVKSMSLNILSMQQNMLQFASQFGGNTTSRTKVASNVEHTPKNPIARHGVPSNGGVGSSTRERQFVILLSQDLKEVAKGYLGTQKTCHDREVVRNEEKVVWVKDVIDPEALIFDGPQNGNYKLSDIVDGDYVIWPVYRLRYL